MVLEMKSKKLSAPFSWPEIKQEKGEIERTKVSVEYKKLQGHQNL